MRFALLAGAGVVAALAGSASAQDRDPARTVILRDISFQPAKLSVRRGQRVTWKWRDGPYVAHDLRSIGRRRFRGASRRTAGSHTVRFRRAGTYRYVCTLHPGMSGRIVVR